MAVVPYDAVREKAKKMWAGLAAAAVLCAVIAVMMGLAVRLVGGFLSQVRGLLRLLLF